MISDKSLNECVQNAKRQLLDDLKKIPKNVTNANVRDVDFEPREIMAHLLAITAVMAMALTEEDIS